MSDNAQAPAPQSVNAGRAVDWLLAGWRLFAADPGVWVAQTLVSIVLLFILGLIPLIGWALSIIAVPLLTGGLLAAARAQRLGRQVTVDMLFDGLRNKPAELALLGVAYFLGTLAAALLAGLVASSGLGGFLFGPGAGIGLTMGSMLFGTLLFSLIWFLLLTALSIAPALVMFDGLSAFDALPTALRTLGQHPAPIVVLGVLAYILSILAVLPAMLGLLIFIPMLAGALEALYQDTHGDGSAAPPALSAPDSY